jgi:hypothetical protein
MTILNNLWTFGIVNGYLFNFFPFWYVWTKKNLATLELIRQRWMNRVTADGIPIVYVGCEQGDQICRIFAQWVIVCFGQLQGDY